MASPVSFAVTFALQQHCHNSPGAHPSLCAAKEPEGDLFTGIEKGIFKFKAGFCWEISKVLIGGIRGHLNIQQAEKNL